MGRVSLSFGYDTERPYGPLATTEAGRDLRKRQLDFVVKLTEALDSEGVPRTFFILGHYLERCLDDLPVTALRQIYNRDNPLNDIQQHSYSHLIFREESKKAGEAMATATPGEFLDDVVMANSTLHEILDVSPRGLRTPRGYSHDLSDIPEILAGLKAAGIGYVSSDLRGEDSFDAPLTQERQPHTYAAAGYPEVVEIPSHGWQDVVFTAEKARELLRREPIDGDDILAHYTGLLDEARNLGAGSPVSVALCLHPWAAMEYDPQLELHKRIVDYARKNEIDLASYSEVADEFKFNE